MKLAKIIILAILSHLGSTLNFLQVLEIVDLSPEVLIRGPVCMILALAIIRCLDALALIYGQVHTFCLSCSHYHIFACSFCLSYWSACSSPEMVLHGVHMKLTSCSTPLVHS
uniref:Uncharacterized protein MANES_11G103700 n=1 Tax=Rhizophora mucronata TaxID=61149 RepID=A0A2P2KMS1_RHIMU